MGLLLFLFIAGFRFFFVSTPSMGQTAPVGSLIISYPKDNYQQGDIVSFYRADKVYTHRIVGVTKDGKFIRDIRIKAEGYYLKPVLDRNKKTPYRK